MTLFATTTLSCSEWKVSSPVGGRGEGEREGGREGEGGRRVDREGGGGEEIYIYRVGESERGRVRRGGRVGG